MVCQIYAAEEGSVREGWRLGRAMVYAQSLVGELEFGEASFANHRRSLRPAPPAISSMM